MRDRCSPPDARQSAGMHGVTLDAGRTEGGMRVRLGTIRCSAPEPRGGPSDVLPFAPPQVRCFVHGIHQLGQSGIG